MFQMFSAIISTDDVSYITLKFEHDIKNFLIITHNIEITIFRVRPYNKSCFSYYSNLACNMELGFIGWS